MGRSLDIARRIFPPRLLDRLRRYASSPAALANSARIVAQSRTVRRSPLFDPDWYRRENPELASGASPALHYVACGAAAGRDPGPGFCGAEYLALHPDARDSGLNALAHFERIGRRRGYRVSPLQPLRPDGRADPAWRFPSPDEHRASFPGIVASIREKASRGERIRAVFFVASAAMFPARPLLDAMRRDPAFDARIAVIPDLRGIAGDDPRPAMARCRAALAADYPPDAFLPAEPDSRGQWPDLLSDFRADLVCHPSPYDLSDFRYNPRWCVGRPVLPVHVNYGYYRSLYDRHLMANRNYAIFWKAFFECPATLAEYVGHSLLRGANAEVVGYVKMDPLARFPANRGPRRRVLLCPHHSVEGGANDSLALSNFLRYADFFADLPARFPEIDFLFRPHPFLFPVLERPVFWGPAKCRAWRERFLSRPNAAWSPGGDYFAEFASADAIVQDCGSYLMEWFYTGRPCCYMLKDPSDVAKFAPIGREALRHCHVAYDEAAIEAFLRDVVLAGRDALAAGRAAFRATMALHWPHAADVALRAIRRDLGLP